MAEKKEEKEFDVDFGVGKITFGGLFKGIGDLIDLASKLGEEGEEIKKAGEIRGLPRQAKGVYGFSVRTMGGGKPIIDTFGNLKETPKGPVVEEVREPMIDVFDEQDHILIIAELPGVSEDEIKIDVEGDILRLTASNKGRKYAKEVLLPAKVNEEGMKSVYRNGILEITLPKG